MNQQEFDAMLQEIHDANRVYWRIYIDDDGSLTPVCLQWFDEHDYDQERFLNKVEYASKEVAEEEARTFDRKMYARSGWPKLTVRGKRLLAEAGLSLEDLFVE